MLFEDRGTACFGEQRAGFGQKDLEAKLFEHAEGGVMDCGDFIGREHLLLLERVMQLAVVRGSDRLDLCLLRPAASTVAAWFGALNHDGSLRCAAFRIAGV